MLLFLKKTMYYKTSLEQYEYQKPFMGLYNSSDIFQEILNKVFNGREYARTYINNLYLISNKSFEDHIVKV